MTSKIKKITMDTWTSELKGLEGEYSAKLNNLKPLNSVDKRNLREMKKRLFRIKKILKTRK